MWAGEPKQTCTQTQSHTLSSLLQPREVMKTNGRVLFPLGPEKELSHQANFILVWPRDSISSGCFYKRWAAPRHRSVMDMRAWWPDGRCWLCNSSSKHLPLLPVFLSQHTVEEWACMQTCAFEKKLLICFMLSDIIDAHVNPWLCLSNHQPKTVSKIWAMVSLADLLEASEDKASPW